MKTCSKCFKLLPFDQFFKQSSMKDGLTASCKPCIKEVQRASLRSKRAREIREQEDAQFPGTKVCTRCEVRLPLESFYKNPCINDGHATACKQCEESLRKIRNVAPKLRTRTPETLGYDNFKTQWNNCKRARRVPGWADQAKILGIYAEKAKLSDQAYDIDHIVPLNNPLVCGLHTEDNLQIITASENRSKGAYWNPDDPLPWELK